MDRWFKTTLIVHSTEVFISFLTPSLHLTFFYWDLRNSSLFLAPSFVIRDLLIEHIISATSSPLLVKCSPRNAFRKSIPTYLISSLVPLSILTDFSVYPLIICRHTIWLCSNAFPLSAIIKDIGSVKSISVKNWVESHTVRWLCVCLVHWLIH